MIPPRRDDYEFPGCLCRCVSVQRSFDAALRGKSTSIRPSFAWTPPQHVSSDYHVHFGRRAEFLSMFKSAANGGCCVYTNHKHQDIKINFHSVLFVNNCMTRTIVQGGVREKVMFWTCPHDLWRWRDVISASRSQHRKALLPQWQKQKQHIFLATATYGDVTHRFSPRVK